MCWWTNIAMLATIALTSASIKGNFYFFAFQAISFFSFVGSIECNFRGQNEMVADCMTDYRRVGIWNYWFNGAAKYSVVGVLIFAFSFLFLI